MHASENQDLSVEQQNELQSIKTKSRNLILDIERLMAGWKEELQNYPPEQSLPPVGAVQPSKAQNAAAFAISYAGTAREFFALAAGSATFDKVIGFYDLGAEFFVAAKRSMDIARGMQ